MQWRRQGVRGGQPPPNRKKLLQKTDGIFEVSIFSNKFSQKIEKNSIFPLNFHQEFSKFSQNFPNNCVFRPNAREFTAWFWNFLQNRRKYSMFCNFLQEFLCEFSKILRRPGAQQPDPLRGRNLTLNPPPKFFPAYATAHMSQIMTFNSPNRFGWIKNGDQRCRHDF